jgi:type III pantothenate kinase
MTRFQSVLLIDAGNTRTKAAWHNGTGLHGFRSFSTPDWEQEVATMIGQGNPPDAVVWLNVGRLEGVEAAQVWERMDKVPFFFPISHQTPLPFRNGYQTPHTLGMDRVAAVAGAQAVFPGRPLLVIDAGTAITYDFLDDKGTYRGGGISPGIKMRFAALHTFTAKLPLIEHLPEIPPLVGYSTESSMRSGVVNGVLAELEGIMQAYQKQADGKLQVVITGGDLGLLEKGIKTSNFADPHLVLSGLYEILIFNTL